MGLPWVRLDSNIATHPKVIKLLKQRDGYRAFTLYVCAIAHCGGHSTDGLVEKEVIDVLHGTEKHARMLVDLGFWEYDPDGKGWLVRNFAHRQEMAAVSAGKKAAQRASATKTNCVRWHGPDCGCWKEAV
jgi:GrpB-like predicted nucleotidyltransferase (UPF0157 family)